MEQRDIVRALDALLTPPVLYRDCSTYARLVETWEDERPVPSEQQIAEAVAGLPESSAERRITAAELMDLLIEKGVIDRQDIDARREHAD